MLLEDERREADDVEDFGALEADDVPDAGGNGGWGGPPGVVALEWGEPPALDRPDGDEAPAVEDDVEDFDGSGVGVVGFMFALDSNEFFRRSGALMKSIIIFQASAASKPAREAGENFLEFVS
jgi:hypothetical protein